MNPLDDATRQQARDWSSHLGERAGQAPTNNPTTTLEPALGRNAPSRLSAILGHFVGRSRRLEDTARTLRTNEFLVGQ